MVRETRKEVERPIRPGERPYRGGWERVGIGGIKEYWVVDFPI